MKELFLSRGQSRARERVFRCPLVTEWGSCSGATLSGKRRVLKKLMC
jgi:hypothetical protein